MDTAAITALLSSPIFTILGTGAASIGAVWIKGRWDLKAEQKRIDAEAAIRDEDLDRQAKEEAAALARRSTEEAREAAREALNGFARILSEFQSLPDGAPASAVRSHWRQKHDSSARQLCELIMHPPTRSGIVLNITALNNFRWYSEDNQLDSRGGHNARYLIYNMMELSGAAARGAAWTPDLAENCDRVRARLQTMFDAQTAAMAAEED